MAIVPVSHSGYLFLSKGMMACKTSLILSCSIVIHPTNLINIEPSTNANSFVQVTLVSGNSINIHFWSVFDNLGDQKSPAIILAGWGTKNPRGNKICQGGQKIRKGASINAGKLIHNKLPIRPQAQKVELLDYKTKNKHKKAKEQKQTASRLKTQS